MPAYFDTGFSVRQPMWHQLGTVLDDYPTDWNDARKKAGLEWEPIYARTFVERVVAACCTSCAMDFGTFHSETCERRQRALDAGLIAIREVGRSDCLPEGAEFIRETDAGLLVHAPATDYQAIVRDDNWNVLAVPTDSFKLIYHSQMGDLLDAYTEAWRKAGAEVKFETAGSVRGGAMVWALVWLDEPYHVPGDSSPTYPFAALLNAHDGSAACKLLPTQVRVVCWNTWKMAEAEGERHGHQVILRHAGNVEERLELAKAGLASMRDEAKEWQVVAADLASININDAVVTTFLDEFIPVPDNASERTRNGREQRRSTFSKLFYESPTNNDLPMTAYRLVQAAGEYLDHLRPFRSQDTYLARTIFSPEPVKRGTIKLVRQLAHDLA